MNRELNFRGRQLDTGEWVYGGIEYQQQINKVYIAQDNGGITCIEVDRKTVGQYTGLKDKNSQKIYEGDVVRFAARSDLMRGVEILPVYYGRGWFLAGTTQDNSFTFSSYADDELEVIGNIYDNPELLK